MSQDRTFSVFTALPAYTAAVAELPVSAALTEDLRGAVAVVPGTGDWWRGMLAAAPAERRRWCWRILLFFHGEPLSRIGGRGAFR
jgi:hypothetical protein